MTCDRNGLASLTQHRFTSKYETGSVPLIRQADDRQHVFDAALAFAPLAQEVGVRSTLLDFWFIVKFQGQHRDDRIGRMLRKRHHRGIFIEYQFELPISVSQ